MIISVYGYYIYPDKIVRVVNDGIHLSDGTFLHIASTYDAAEISARINDRIRDLQADYIRMQHETARDVALHVLPKIQSQTEGDIGLAVGNVAYRNESGSPDMDEATHAVLVPRSESRKKKSKETT